MNKYIFYVVDYKCSENTGRYVIEADNVDNAYIDLDRIYQDQSNASICDNPYVETYLAWDEVTIATACKN